MRRAGCWAALGSLSLLGAGRGWQQELSYDLLGLRGVAVQMFSPSASASPIVAYLHNSIRVVFVPNSSRMLPDVTAPLT